MAARPVTSGAKGMKKTSLDRDTLNNMHKILLCAEHYFPAPWMAGFSFRERGMLCGLRQREGGPCGVLATVQAFTLRELLSREGAAPLHLVSREDAGDALVAALSHVIWSARVGRLANVVSCTSGKLPPLREAAGELTCTQCSSAVDVATAVRGCIGL